MAYDESLAARVRQSLAGRPDVEEKPMFGGLTFMVAGNMCCGVNRDDLIIRLDAGPAVEDLHSPQVRAWDFMKRPILGIQVRSEASELPASPLPCAEARMNAGPSGGRSERGAIRRLAGGAKWS